MGAHDKAVREQLEMQIAAIQRDCPAPRAAEPVYRQPEPVIAEDDTPHGTEPFGRWLLAQKGRGDWIDDLAAAARRDPGFPKSGSPDQVRVYLGKRGIVDPDVFEQIDDAERVWRSL